MRARRIIGFVFAGVAAVLALALCAAAFLLFTTPGAKVVLSVVNARPLPVHARAIGGTLGRRFTLYDAELRGAPVEAKVDTVVVAWRPMALRTHRVDLADVVVAGARVLVTPAPDSARAESPRPDGAPARTRWTVTADRVRVRRTSVDAPGGVHLRDVDVAASGGLDNYRATIRAAGSAWRGDNLRVFVRASGSTRAVAADSLDLRALDGVVRGEAFIRWTPGLSWRARLEGDSLRAGQLAKTPQDWLGAIAFRARSTGLVHADTTRVGIDLASLEGTLRGRPLSARARIDIDGARIAASGARVRWGSAHATLSGGMAEAADVTLDATIPSLSEILPRARGSARVWGRVTGTPARIDVRVDAEGRGVRAARWDVPDFDATVDAALSARDYVPHAAEIRHAGIRVGDGRLEVTGSVSWLDGAEWNASLAAHDFETSTLTPARWNLRGPVTVRATTSGVRRGKALRADLAIASLAGTLRGRALRGGGRVAVENTEADFTDLNLEWGGTRLRADGHAGQTLDLGVDLAAPDLSLLVPSWRGAVTLQGRAHGPRRRPAITATIAADSVRLRDYAVHHLDARVDADPSFASPADIRLTALGVSRGGSALDTVRVTASGPRDGHTATLVVARGGAHALVAVRGTYADSAWSGWIEDARLRHTAVGELRTSRRAPLHVSRTRIVVDSLDLASRNTHFVADGAWRRGGQAHARVQLERFELSALERHLGPDARVTGALHGTAELAVDPRAGIDAHLELVPGPGELTRGGKTLAYGGRIAARADGTGVSATIAFDVTSEGARLAAIDGDLSIPGFVAGRDSLGTQPLAGTLDAECANIGPVLAVLAPRLSKSSGALVAHVTPQGTAGDFRLVGRVVLEKARFDTLRGLHLRDADLTLVSDGDGRVSLDGAVTSGGGRVSIAATSAQSERGWINGTFTAKGERFQLINRPDAQVFISPDLEMRLAERVAVVTGDIRVPYARIETAQVPASATSSSSDVIIVEDTLTTRPKVQVRTQVRVALGDSVTFSGFGLRARLAGGLVVDDQRGRPTRGTGEIQIVDGKYRAFGNELTIDPGRFVFGGGPIDNPGIDVRAYRGLTTQNVMAGSGEMVGVNLRGTLRRPELSVFSNPPMSESEIMSYLLFGRPASTGSGGEQSALAGAATLIGMQRGTQLAGDIGKKVALDEAYIESGSQVGEASFVAGKYLSPKLYVSYAAGLFEHTNTFRARYSLANRWTLQAESGKANSTDILYWFERGR